LDTATLEALDDAMLAVARIELFQVADILSDLEKNSDRDEVGIGVVKWQRTAFNDPLLEVGENLGPWNMTQAGVKADKGIPEVGQTLDRIENAGMLGGPNKLKSQLVNWPWLGSPV
jgi:hypothetical protein